MALKISSRDIEKNQTCCCDDWSSSEDDYLCTMSLYCLDKAYGCRTSGAASSNCINQQTFLFKISNKYNTIYNKLTSIPLVDQSWQSWWPQARKHKLVIEDRIGFNNLLQLRHHYTTSFYHVTVYLDSCMLILPTNTKYIFIKIN